MKTLRAEFLVENYDLAATLASGQAFRWREMEGGWHGIVSSRWVRLRVEPGRFIAETATPSPDWNWLRHYLQLDVDVRKVVAQFPSADQTLQTAAQACAGLRLLRQDPWECLASFICSSTKQITQIRQIIALLAERFGEPIAVPDGHEPAWSFPTSKRLAAASESSLRDCKLGFRAPYLRAAAQKIEAGEVDLTGLPHLSLDEARAALCHLPGVGEKIADCVLLFGYGFAEAFPVDVWIMKVLRQHYWPRRRMKPARMRHFIKSHFGPQAGYAQQYLFHYMRTKG